MRKRTDAMQRQISLLSLFSWCPDMSLSIFVQACLGKKRVRSRLFSVFFTTLFAYLKRCSETHDHVFLENVLCSPHQIICSKPNRNRNP